MLHQSCSKSAGSRILTQRVPTKHGLRPCRRTSQQPSEARSLGSYDHSGQFVNGVERQMYEVISSSMDEPSSSHLSNGHAAVPKYKRYVKEQWPGMAGQQIC